MLISSRELAEMSETELRRLIPLNENGNSDLIGCFRLNTRHTIFHVIGRTETHLQCLPFYSQNVLDIPRRFIDRLIDIGELEILH